MGIIKALPEFIVILLAFIALIQVRSGVKVGHPAWEQSGAECAKRTGLPKWQVNAIYAAIVIVAGLFYKFLGAIIVLLILP